MECLSGPSVITRVPKSRRENQRDSNMGRSQPDIAGFEGGGRGQEPRSEAASESFKSKGTDSALTPPC